MGMMGIDERWRDSHWGPPREGKGGTGQGWGPPWGGRLVYSACLDVYIVDLLDS